MNVHIITCVRTPDALDTGTLTFRTIRTGFPNARIFVHDNESVMRQEVYGRAKHFDMMWQPHQRRSHASLIEGIIVGSSEPTVILDPDLIFWDNCEPWAFDDEYLIGGRYIPTHKCPVLHSIVMPRYHTSFLTIPQPQQLVRRLEAIVGIRDENIPIDFYSPAMMWEEGNRLFYDTTANLYAALGGGGTFEETELNCYDHLFCGTCLDKLDSHTIDLHSMDARSIYDRAKMIHTQAIKDPNSIRGLWRNQDEYYKRYAI